MRESLGAYKILEPIGSGGMGDVFRARDTRHGRTVAIKLLPAPVADDPARRGPFLRDARAAASLSHPNIVTLYEVGEDGAHLFLVFDFVPGETLKSVIAGRPLNLRRALDLAAQIADGLADAHAAGVVHRDIRPDNVIVTPKGAAKIMDTGLAAWTRGGTAAGGPYRAPEYDTRSRAGHASNDAPGDVADERVDIFSLGVVLYEMLTGAPPPSPIVGSWPTELDAIVSKALAKSLERRYQSAVSLAADLRKLIATLDARTESKTGGPAQAATPVVGRSRRRSAAAMIAVAIAVAALAALGALAWALYAR